MSKFFVMLRVGDGRAAPLEDDQGDVALFDSEEKADAAAEANLLGDAFGWATYEWRE